MDNAALKKLHACFSAVTRPGPKERPVCCLRSTAGITGTIPTAGSRRFAAVTDFTDELDTYIHWYNHVRIKEKLNGLSPVLYRTQLRLTRLTASRGSAWGSVNANRK
ncbi:IS3 family transposase [Arthrobacter sp. UYCu723]